MNPKSPCLLVFAAAALFLSAPAFAADAAPLPAPALCSTQPPLALPWLQLTVCPQSFCNDDDECRGLCPSDPGAYCQLSTWTCVYPSSGGSGGGGGCQSGSICTPARFCDGLNNCSTCGNGCSGYCASDGICRVI